MKVDREKDGQRKLQLQLEKLAHEMKMVNSLKEKVAEKESQIKELQSEKESSKEKFKQELALLK